MAHSLLMTLISRILPLPQRRTAMGHRPADTEITKQQLGLALEQRSIMDVAFVKPELADMGFSGPCLRITGTAMHIDTPFHGNQSVCVDEAVEVRFTVTHENITSYFRFSSNVRGYHPDSGFVLDFPMGLLSGQRREFVRIAPPEGALLYLEIWPLESDALPPPQSFTAAYGSGRTINDEVALENISAGGFRLKIKTRPDDPAARFAEGSRLLCLLRLKHMGANRTPFAGIAMPQCNARQNNEDVLALWLSCTVKYCTEPDASACVCLGAEYTAWAVPALNGDLPSWANVGKARRIHLLLDWVWKERLAHSARLRQKTFRAATS